MIGFTWCPLWSAGLHFFHLGLQGQPRVRRSLVAWCFHHGFLPWNIRNIYEIYVPIYEMWINMKAKPAVEIPAGSKASKPSNIWGYLIFFLVENLRVFFSERWIIQRKLFSLRDWYQPITSKRSNVTMSPTILTWPPNLRGSNQITAEYGSVHRNIIFLGLNPAVFLVAQI
jgi:hypothetical protein